MESHVIFQHGVSADEYLNIARAETVEYCRPFLLALYGTCQQRHLHRQSIQKLAESGIMLFCQYLRRSHEAGLVIVVKGYKHRHQCNKRFARPNIALQQTVHLLAAAHVMAHLTYHALLCLGEAEGQIMLIEGIKQIADMAKHVSEHLLLTLTCITQYTQLNEEEFLELLTIGRSPEGIGRGRIVKVVQRLCQRHQQQSVYYALRQCLRHHLTLQALKQRTGETLYAAAIEAAAFHLLGSIVIRLQSHCP